MKNKKNWAVIAIIAIAATAGLYAQSPKKVMIDFQINTKTVDSKNYFNWTADKVSVKDKFDATKVDAAHGTTGASIAQSTAEFDKQVFRDKDNKKTFPYALRGLFLFGVTNPATFQSNFGLDVTQDTDKSITIRYINRGTAYVIKSDTKGVIDIANPASCKMLANVALSQAGAFILAPDYLKTGGDNTKFASVDWAKVNPKLVTDSADSATTQYSGKLTVQLGSKGILTIKGTLDIK
ncbi:MAG: hypothetical protein Pg6C_14160 [Treponemataceae bacterium]|nr:MAG: hypothetical protein Pg6C_14160 [Treponemataceae bacterium]